MGPEDRGGPQACMESALCPQSHLPGCTVECYSVIKVNEIASFAGRWMEPEFITLNETSQTQGGRYFVFSNI